MTITGIIFSFEKEKNNMAENNKNLSKDELSDEIDSPQNREELKDIPTHVDIPDAHEIPGQENFEPAPLGDLAGTTISSSDEEGDEVFDENIDQEIMDSPDSNVSDQEKDALRRTFADMPGDDENLREAALDNRDEDGEELNEGSFENNISASDLDIPGEELDDANENIGEEDEENNEYSLGGDNDDIPRDDF